jgi:hypothetical protein
VAGIGVERDPHAGAGLTVNLVCRGDHLLDHRRGVDGRDRESGRREDRVLAGVASATSLSVDHDGPSTGRRAMTGSSAASRRRPCSLPS